MKKVIGIVGLPASGKSTAISSIKNKYPIVTMGDVIRDETKKRGLEQNSENLGKIARLIRQEHGDMIVAERCVEKIKAMDSPIIIVDGIRSMDEVIYFRKFWEFPVIAILCEDQTRYKRLSKRGRSDDSSNIDDIIERDTREISFGLKDVIANANYKIENDSSPEELQDKMKNTINIIISSSKQLY